MLVIYSLLHPLPWSSAACLPKCFLHVLKWLSASPRISAAEHHAANTCGCHGGFQAAEAPQQRSCWFTSHCFGEQLTEKSPKLSKSFFKIVCFCVKLKKESDCRGFKRHTRENVKHFSKNEDKKTTKSVVMSEILSTWLSFLFFLNNLSLL